MMPKVSFSFKSLIFFILIFFEVQILKAETLLEVIDLAFKNSYEYLAKVDTFNADYAYKGLAKSYILPTLDLTADIKENNINQNYSSSTSSQSDINTAYPYLGAAITLKQPLFDKAAWSLYSESKLMAERAQIQLDNDRNKIILQGVQYYLEVLNARDNLQFTTNQKKLLEQQLKETTAKANVGKVKKVEIDQVLAEERNAQYELINATNELQVKKDQLNKFINQEIVEYAYVKKDITKLNLKSNNLQDWLDTSSKGNLDILYNQINLKIADQDLAITKAGYYPNIALVGSYGVNKTKDYMEYTDSYNEQSGYLGLSLKMNLFQGGSTKNEAKQKQFKKSSLNYDLKALQNQISVMTKQYFLNVDNGAIQVEALDKAVISSGKYLESAQVSYKVGLKTTTDVLLATKDYYNAERNFSNAKYEYLFAIINLKSTTGILTIDDVKQISEYLVIISNKEEAEG